MTGADVPVTFELKHLQLLTRWLQAPDVQAF